jgi:lysyl-tRNA synthetase class 2
MMEVYQAYGDLAEMMDLTEGVFAACLEEIQAGPEMPFGEQKLNFSRPWVRRKWNDLLKEHAGVGLEDETSLRRRATELGREATGDLAAVADRLFETCVERQLVQPTFVVDYPVALCPLTKTSAADPRFAERFELYISGMECANAYTELNDPLDQQRRFEKQIEQEPGQVRKVDEDFIRALKFGMPPAGGLGIGIDRLVMILTNSTCIRDVILFPLMRQ